MADHPGECSWLASLSARHRLEHHALVSAPLYEHRPARSSVEEGSGFLSPVASRAPVEDDAARRRSMGGRYVSSNETGSARFGISIQVRRRDQKGGTRTLDHGGLLPNLLPLESGLGVAGYGLVYGNSERALYRRPEIQPRNGLPFTRAKFSESLSVVKPLIRSPRWSAERQSVRYPGGLCCDAASPE
jgi:hypothetical protein